MTFRDSNYCRQPINNWRTNSNDIFYMSEIISQGLINSPYKVVLYVTGVGSTALQQFTLYPGSSKFALESGNYYAEGSLIDLLEQPIAKYVTQEVADKMALKALLRSHQILRSQGNSDAQNYLYCVGVGVSGAISSSAPRKGKHHAYVSYHFGSRKYSYYMNLEKGARTRIQEDTIISQKILEVLLFHCQQNQGKFNDDFQQTQFNQSTKNEQVIEFGTIECLAEYNNVCPFELLIKQSQYLHSILIDHDHYVLNPYLQRAVILSGSFNPPHQGHIDLAFNSAQRLDFPNVYFELSIVNADKGEVNQDEIFRRIAMMKEKNLKIIISNRPLFKDKNVFLQNGAFAIGADTYKRLIDIKYYNNSVSERDISFIKFLQQNNKIIVAPRFNEQTQKLEALPDFEIPPLIAKHTIEIKGFRNDLSSTQIRKKDNIRAQSTPH